MTDVRRSTKLTLLVDRSVMCRGQATGSEAGSWPPSFHPDLHEKVQERLSAECGDSGGASGRECRRGHKATTVLIWDDAGGKQGPGWVETGCVDHEHDKRPRGLSHNSRSWLF